jgi:hypothetical protein
MKKFLLACSLLAVSATMAVAQQPQSAQSHTTQSEDPRLMLVSKINELEAALSRDRKDLAQPLFQEVSAIMQQRLAIRSAELQQAAASDKAALEQQLQEGQKIYQEAKIMSPNMAQDNGQAMIALLRRFIAVY